MHLIGNVYVCERSTRNTSAWMRNIHQIHKKKIIRITADEIRVTSDVMKVDAIIISRDLHLKIWTETGGLTSCMHYSGNEAISRINEGTREERDGERERLHERWITRGEMDEQVNEWRTNIRHFHLSADESLIRDVQRPLLIMRFISVIINSCLWNLILTKAAVELRHLKDQWKTSNSMWGCFRVIVIVNCNYNVKNWFFDYWNKIKYKHELKT